MNDKKLISVVNFLVEKYKTEAEENDLTNLKLQKLLYYIQGFSLALRGQPMFCAKISHWNHGPVVNEAYDLIKTMPKLSILTAKFCENKKLPDLSDEEKSIISIVNSKYGQFSAWKLRNMTHEENPWKNTKDSEEITTENLKTFFETLVA